MGIINCSRFSSREKKKYILSGLRRNDTRLYASLHAAQNLSAVNELPMHVSFSVYLPATSMKVRTLLTPTSQLIGILLLGQDFPVVLSRPQRGLVEQLRLGYHMFLCALCTYLCFVSGQPLNSHFRLFNPDQTTNYLKPFKNTCPPCNVHNILITSSDSYTP